MPSKKMNSKTSQPKPTSKSDNSVKKKTSGAKKTSKKETVEAPVVPVEAPVEPPVKVEAPVEPPVKVEAPVDETTPLSTESNTESSSPSLEEQFASVTQKLADLKTLQVTLTTELKLLHKNTTKHLKNMNKKKKKVHNDKKPRAPSGFAKPAKMSKELCDFLNEPVGTEMARTVVTKHITNYVKEHNLQNQENRRQILCDDKLMNLLKVDDTVVLTYFNLQKYMKVHFIKTEPNAVSI